MYPLHASHATQGETCNGALLNARHPAYKRAEKRGPSKDIRYSITEKLHFSSGMFRGSFSTQIKFAVFFDIDLT